MRAWSQDESEEADDGEGDEAAELRLHGADEKEFMSLLEAAAEAGMSEPEVMAYLKAAELGEVTPELIRYEEEVDGSGDEEDHSG